MPHYDGVSSSGVGKGYLEKPAAVRKGSGKPWPFGLHVAGYRYKIQNKKTKNSQW